MITYNTDETFFSVHSNLFCNIVLFVLQLSILFTIIRHVFMKDFFTWFVAVVLLSLCLLEKEARKNALLMESKNNNIAQSSRIANKEPVNQNVMSKPGIQDNNKMVAGDAPNAVDYGRLVSTDSLNFSFGAEKQEAKIF